MQCCQSVEQSLAVNPVASHSVNIQASTQDGARSSIVRSERNEQTHSWHVKTKRRTEAQWTFIIIINTTLDSSIKNGENLIIWRLI